MADNPLVSVLVPLYNKQDTVVSTIESALAQTYSNLEIIVVDDGSTDRSVERVRVLSDPRISLITRENRGANVTRNELLRRSSGEFVQFLDADDWLDPDKIARQVDVMCGDCAVVFSFVRELRGPYARRMPGLVAGGDLQALVVRHGVAVHAPLHRRAVLEESGGFDESLLASQEFDLHLRLLNSGAWNTAASIEEVLAHWNRGPNSTSSSDLVVYREKARVLVAAGRASTDERIRELCAESLLNAGRHLARDGDFRRATDAFRDAASLSDRIGSHLPARLRPFARSPRALVAIEVIEAAVRRSRRLLSRSPEVWR